MCTLVIQSLESCMFNNTLQQQSHRANVLLALSFPVKDVACQTSKPVPVSMPVDEFTVIISYIT